MKIELESKFDIGQTVNVGDNWPKIIEVKYRSGQWNYALSGYDYWYTESILENLILKNNEKDATNE